MHKSEIHLTSNTATLARECLTNAEIRVRGTKDGALNLDDLEDDHVNLVLFPAGNAEVLDAHYLEKLKGKKVRLIVPDGTWSQAKKAVKREKLLHKFPKVKLSPGPLSLYHLRKEPTPESVCTFEAIARALGIFHGDEIQKDLEKVLTLMVERTLWSKSRIKTEDCTYPIPQKAIHHRLNPPKAGDILSFEE